MGQASTIGLDIAKRVFQAHGADATGRVVFRKRLVRAKVLDFSRGSRPVLWRWRLVAGRTTGRGSSASWATRCSCFGMWRRQAALALNGTAGVRVSGKGPSSYTAQLPTPTGRSLQHLWTPPSGQGKTSGMP